MDQQLSRPRYNTMVGVAETYLRDAILSGRLKPGERINQDQIAEELESSRMPIREALHKLERSGFVVIQPHRGVKVAELSVSQIEETYMMRSLLESFAARLAAENMTEATIHELGEILNGIERAVEGGDPERLFDLNCQFHKVGYANSGKKFLCQTIDNLRDQCERYRRFHTRLSQRTFKAMEEHRNIFRAWSARDAEQAEYWTRVNLDNSAKAVISAIRAEL